MGLEMMDWNKILEWILALGIILIPVVMILGIWFPSHEHIWLKILKTDIIIICSGFYLYMGMN
jgi:hypothetical protein